MTFPSRAGWTVRRRDVLRLTAAVPIATALTTSCMAGKPDGPDPLTSLVLNARSDAALANAVAAAHPDLNQRARSVAHTRTQHADALEREMNRVNPPDPESPKPPLVAAPARPPASSTQAKSSLNEALRSAQQRASELVPTLPSYRAGLVGSVSASCASLLEVLA